VRSIVRPAALVQAWLDTLRPDQQQAALALNAAALAAEPALTRAIKWGNLVFMHGGVHAVAVAIHRDHANLHVFNGALLAAHFPSLEGTGKGMRHLKFRYTQAPDAALVQAVVRASVEQLAAARASTG
jgi:hypothetical protein